MQNRAFSIVEVLVVVAIIALLAAIGTSATAGVREKGRQTACASNLKSIYMAGVLYGSENDDAEPIAPTVPLSRRYFGRPSIIASRVGKAAMYCPDFPDCARRFYGSAYSFPVVPPRPDEPRQQRAEAVMRELIARFGTEFPLAYCLSHDEVFYAPREQDQADFLNPPFVLSLRADGSVRAGRLDVHRDRVIERYCRLPDKKP